VLAGDWFCAFSKVLFGSCLATLPIDMIIVATSSVGAVHLVARSS
jgi:hypothetical protein